MISVKMILSILTKPESQYHYEEITEKKWNQFFGEYFFSNISETRFNMLLTSELKVIQKWCCLKCWIISQNI